MKIVVSCLLFFLLGCKFDQNQIIEGTKEYAGYKLYTDMACNACHTVDGSLKLGPSLQAQYGKEILHTDGSVIVVDDDYIRESIKDPLKYIVEGYTPIMPNYSPILSDDDIENIISYIKLLK